MMREMIEQVMFAGLSPRGLIAFGWSHPVAQALGAGVAEVLATRAVAGECEAGTIELTLGAPVSRSTWLLAHAAAGLAALALVSAAGTVATALALRLFRLDPIAPPALLRLGANHLALQAAWFGVTLALSAGSRDGGRVSGAAFLLALASYVADVIGRLWAKAAFVLPYSLYHHFAAQDILARDAAVGRPVALLGAVAAAGIAVAWWRFERRDLP
jgi:ABC-type transport system involved in multi-copper enzyme maturation permease subunit